MEETPYSFGIDTDSETVFRSFTGSIDTRTFIEAGEALTDDPRWQHNRDCLYDLRQTEVESALQSEGHPQRGRVLAHMLAYLISKRRRQRYSKHMEVNR